MPTPTNTKNSHPSSLPVALVTGASRGIGLACAQALQASGYRVAIHYRSDQELAHHVAKTLPGSLAFYCDLTQPNSLSDLTANVQEKMGDIHVLVNNAGTAFEKLAHMSSGDDFDRVINTNLKATFLLCKAVTKGMIRNKSGRIINITSILGHTGQRGQSLYSASKAAVSSFTRSLAAELGRFAILCNCVAPGYILTKMTENMPSARHAKIIANIHLERPGLPQEVAEVVAFLASDKASYITGSTIHVNGGLAGF
ncbi:MAG: 3-oxoacyl-ACP reductase FabG [Proteobacteria bacterium]|nr:3-oxoacyl-ACP reductase FabG [Pseudomonadota bacterium]